MSFHSRLALIAALWTVAAGQAFAAPATAEGAAHLTEVLQRYLGKTEGVVTVMPNGESYAVTLDAAPLVALVPADGGAITLSAQHLTLTDQGGGLWAVAQNEPVSFSMTAPKAMEMSMQIGSMSMNGIFDESLSGFQSWTADMTDMAMTQKVAATPEAPGQDVTQSIAAMHSEFAGERATSVGTDGTFTATGTGFREIITMARSEAMPAGLTIDATAETMRQSGTIKGLRSAPILDLVAFLVAHPSEAAIKADQEVLRGQVQAALPLFDALDGTFSYEGLTVTTPYGGGTADSIAAGIDMAGLVADGRVREKITVSGLALTDGLVPGWAKDLVPTDFTFDVTGSGFNLAEPAAIIVAALDLTAEKPLTDEVGATLVSALLPKGNFYVTFAPGQVVAPLYQLDFEGAVNVTVNGAPPTGQGTVRAIGMDAVIEALNKGPAEVAQSAGPVLAMARGIAKQGGVGELIWKLDGTQPGTLKVNDLDLSALGAMMGQ